MKKVFYRAAAAMMVMVVAFATTPMTGECSKLWSRKPGVGISKVSFSSVQTAQNDQSMISGANWLYRDRKTKELTEEARAIGLKNIAEAVEDCNAEVNYATTPDAIAYVVDTGLYVDQIDQFKIEGKLPAYYEYRPLNKYPKTGKEELQKLIDSGVDLSPVFDKDWFFYHICAGSLASEEWYRDLFVKYLVSGVQGCATFDVDAYKEYNPDLYAIYGNDNYAYAVHYLTKGKDEGRISVYPPEEYVGCFGGAFDTPEKAAETIKSIDDNWNRLLKSKYLQ